MPRVRNEGVRGSSPLSSTVIHTHGCKILGLHSLFHASGTFGGGRGDLTPGLSGEHAAEHPRSLLMDVEPTHEQVGGDLVWGAFGERQGFANGAGCGLVGRD